MHLKCCEKHYDYEPKSWKQKNNCNWQKKEKTNKKNIIIIITIITIIIITNNNFEHIVITSYIAKHLIIDNYWYIDSSDLV